MLSIRQQQRRARSKRWPAFCRADSVKSAHTQALHLTRTTRLACLCDGAGAAGYDQDSDDETWLRDDVPSARWLPAASASPASSPPPASHTHPISALSKCIKPKLYVSTLESPRLAVFLELQIALWYVRCLRKQGPHPTQCLTVLPAHLARVIMSARSGRLQDMIVPWGAHSYGEQLLHSCNRCGAALQTAVATFEHSMFDCEEPFVGSAAWLRFLQVAQESDVSPRSWEEVAAAQGRMRSEMQAGLMLDVLQPDEMPRWKVPQYC